MSGRSNTFKNNLLKLIFNNVDFAGVGDAAGLLGSTADGNLFIRLYTDASVLSDSALGTEATFGGYAAVAVGRDTTSWLITSNVAKNGISIEFPACTSGEETIRYFAIWANSSGSESDRLYWGQLNTDVLVITNTTVYFPVEYIEITEN